MESTLPRSRWKSLTLFIVVFGVAVLCSLLFVISFSPDFKYYLFGHRSIRHSQTGDPDVPSIKGPESWQDTLIKFSPTITALISATGTVSGGILAWKISRRDARERDLKIQTLELQLEELKQKHVSPQD